MKKVMIFICATVLCTFVCVLGTSTSNASTVATIETSVANLNVPTGVYFNGSNFIKVESTWLRIVIHGEKMFEVSFDSEKDPFGNYVLKFKRNGSIECITIYSNGRSLNYNGSTYSKK